MPKQVYQPNKYGDEAVQTLIDYRWIALTPGRSGFVYYLMEHELDSDEELTGARNILSSQPPRSHKWINLEDSARTVSPRSGASPFLMNFYLSPDRQYYTRSVYNGLDLAKDVGGLAKFSTLFARFLVWLFYKIFGNPLRSKIVNSLFYKEDEKRWKDDDAIQESLTKLW